jgi:hypothetical protein
MSIDQLIEWINWAVTPLSDWFNYQTSKIDFFLFCIIYSLIFIYIGYSYHKRTGWVAKNRELLSMKEIIGAKIIETISTLPLVKIWWKNKLRK